MSMKLVWFDVDSYSQYGNFRAKGMDSALLMKQPVEKSADFAL